ncbi:MAG: arylsulfatase [Gemmataceae bacterium]
MRSRFLVPAATVAVGCVLGWLVPSGPPAGVLAQDAKAKPAPAGGTQLPKPDPAFTGKIGETYKDSTPSYPQPVKAPKGSPNVLLILLDDVGFGMCSTFGGPVPTPQMQRLADNGLKYTRFHTTALCSPTRGALLTGRNHHSCGTGVIIEMGTGYPGYTGIIPRSTAVVAQTLRDNGYATGMFGKWHNTPEPDISPAGPFDRWPTGLGFEYFYGFNQGETHQYYPVIYRNTTWVPPPKTPEQGYHFTADMTDEAIAWTRNVRAADRDKPWFNYFSTSGVHAPHHAPKAYRDKYKGKFDHGWDRQRELTHARQLETGVIPKGTKLTPRPASIPSWDSRSADEKRVYARLMENYAGYMDYTDAEVGRLVESLRQSGELDNTLVMYVVGDNGASAEGGLEGTFSEIASLLGVQLGLESTIKRIDEIGGPTSEPHVPVGWAWAMDAPFQWTKQVASHFGGTRNPLVVHWPKGIKAKGETRTQFHHVIDVVPTILEACKVPRAEGGQRHPAEADRGGVDAVLVRRRDGEGAADDAILRAGDQPGDLPRRLGGVQPLRVAVGDRRGRGRVPDGPVGAVPYRRGLQPGRRPRGEAAGQAQGATGEVRRGSDEIRRVPARPAVLGADGPEAADGRGAKDELDLLRQQRLASGADRPTTVPPRPHDYGGPRDPQGRGRGRRHLRGGVLGRVVAVRPGRQAGIPVHVLRHRRRDHSRHGRAA